MKRASYNRRFHGFRRVRSKAEVPANTINSERTQAYAVDSVIEIVNARVVFVASFESTVMSGGPRRVTLSQRTLIFGHSKHCGRAGVDHSLDGVRSATRRFEDINCTDDINHCSETRVGLADRNLQAREVNNMTDSELVYDRRQRISLSNDAGDQRGSRDLVLADYQTQAARIGALIKH